MFLTLCLGLFLPLIGFLSLALGSNFLNRRIISSLACLTILTSFLCFCTILFLYESENMPPQNINFYHWIPIEGIDAQFSLRIDPLSLLMSLIITGIGFLIHVYSIGYIEHEKDDARYFACLNFFIFAMLLLVLAGDLLLLFVGWEGVGLASYLLIGYWYHRPAAAQAATKAFIVNRIGDFGFLIGLLLLFSIFETSQFSEVFQKIEQFSIGSPLLTLMTFLFFIGAVGKSAQLPLHVWLPDAMEGPTPVSALIHAATMVTAGVYLVVRLHPIFMLTPMTMHFIGFIGGSTAIFAALTAVAQTDLKRVLAYSTISQLGLMFLACGIGAFYAAMFHLTTHAFVKGLLFLSAGNVVHMMHSTTDMGKMGSLAKVFSKTHWLFLIGVLAMSGVPPLSAFFSKDLILEQEHLAGFDTLFYIALATSILTGFYLMRAYCLTFLGPRRTKLDEIHEAPPIMLTPVTTLAFLSVIGGFLGFCLFCKTPLLESFLAEVGVTLAEKEELNISALFTTTTFLSIGGVLLGVLTAVLLYTRFANRLGSTIQLLKRAFFIDELYEKVIIHPLKSLSSLINAFVEPKIFEGSLQLTTHITKKIALEMQRFQSGQVRSYIAWMVLGSVFLMFYLIL